MSFHNIFPLLFLQVDGAQPAGDLPPDAAPGGGGQFMIVMLGMILIFYFLLIRPQMKENKRRKAMLAAVKKHDRVITNGGMFGVVVSVSDTEVVLKVDDSSNTRIKFSRSAIASILQDEGGAQS
jgi:preprotein translocase subunit YajC